MRLNEAKINRLNAVSVRSVVEATETLITDIKNSNISLDNAILKLFAEIRNHVRKIINTGYLFDEYVKENLEAISIKLSILIKQNYLNKYNNLFISLNNKITECLNKHGSHNIEPYK